LGPVGQDKIVIIPHGVASYDRSFPSESSARKTYGWHDRIGKSSSYSSRLAFGHDFEHCCMMIVLIVLLSTGLIQPDKGFQTVINALPLLVERMPQILYIIAGEAHRDNVYSTQYLADLRALVKRLDLSRHVKFMDHFLTSDEQIDLIRASDYFIAAYTNSYISSSGTVSTALSLGRVVLTTPFMYAREILGDGRGVIFPFQDHNALAIAIGELHRDQHRCDIIRQKAHSYAQSITWAKVGQQYLRVLHQAATLHHVH
jgi:glycosyltransferase involved in cell wall biosynthesis